MLGNHVFWLLMLFYTHFAALSVTFRAVAFYSYPPPPKGGVLPYISYKGMCHPIR